MNRARLAALAATLDPLHAELLDRCDAVMCELVHKMVLGERLSHDIIREGVEVAVAIRWARGIGPEADAYARELADKAQAFMEQQDAAKVGRA